MILPSAPPSGTSTPTPSSFRIRRRTPSDLPALCDLLTRQQPVSNYPISWPLPMPVERFIARPAEVASFVAESASGALLGHVAIRSGLGGPPDEEELTERWAAAHGCEEKDVRVISVLFTDPAASGTGVGSALFRAATIAALEDGGRPCLDVLSTNVGPLAFYQRRGWKIIGEWDAPWVPGTKLLVYLMILPLEAVEGGYASPAALDGRVSGRASGTATPVNGRVEAVRVQA